MCARAEARGPPLPRGVTNYPVWSSGPRELRQKVTVATGREGGTALPRDTLTPPLCPPTVRHRESTRREGGSMEEEEEGVSHKKAEPITRR